MRNNNNINNSKNNKIKKIKQSSQLSFSLFSKSGRWSGFASVTDPHGPPSAALYTAAGPQKKPFLVMKIWVSFLLLFLLSYIKKIERKTINKQRT